MRPMRGTEAHPHPKAMDQDLIRVLHVEDDPFDRGLVRESLKAAGGFFLAEATKQADFQRMLEAEEWDCVLTDLHLSGYTGLDVLDRTRALRPGLPVVFLSSGGSEEIAVDAMKRGAADYVLKNPVHYVKLPLVLRNAVSVRKALSDRERAEEALDEREVAYRQLFEANPSPMWIYDSATLTLLEVNAAAVRQSGWSQEEFLGMKVTDIDESPGAWEFARNNATAVGAGLREVRRHRRKDGTSLFAEVSSHPLTWGDKAARVALIHDITERMRAEEDLKETLAELNTIQQAAPVGVLLVSNRVIIRCNHALSRITGYSREELAWKSANMLCLSEDEAQKFWDVAEPQIAQTGRYACERPIRCKDGAMRWVRLVGQAVDRLELWRGAIWVVEDLEEMRGAQAALARLAEDLAQAQRIGHLGSWSRNFDTGEVIYTAEQFRLFGLDPSEQPPKSVDEFLMLVHEADRPAMAATYDRVIRTGDQAELEIRVARAPEGERWLHVRMRGERDARGHVFRAFGINQDITTQKHAQDEILRSRDYYRTLLEEFPAMVWQTGVDGSCVYINRAFEESVGAARGELIGAGWSSVVHPDDRESSAATFHEHFKARQAYTAEYRLRTADGEYRWVQEQGTPYRNLDGAFGGFIGVCVDLSERMRAEQALRESETRLKKILEDMPVMLDAFDEQWNIVAWNRECERVTGYSAAEIIGNPRAMELLYPDDAYRNRMMAEWKARGHDYRGWEWTLWAKDGTPRTILWSNLSRHFPIEGWASWGTGVDITAWRRAEERLEQNEKRFRAIVDVAGDAIFVADLDGNIVDFNAAACESLGYACEELMRLNICQLDPKAAELPPGELRSFHERAMQEALLWEGTHRRKDGTTFPVQVRVSGVRLGDQRFVVGVARNVTEQKRAEEALATSELRFRTLIEKSSDLLVVVDEQGVFRYSGPSVQQILGYAPGGLIGTSAFDLVHPDDVARARGILGELLAHPGGTAQAMLRVKDSAGRWRDVDFLARNLLDNPVVGGIVINARDLTGRAPG